MGINRAVMPQTDSSDIDKVIEALKKTCEVMFEQINVRELHPIQSNVIKEKVVKMYTNVKESKTIVPIFVSEDNFIIDGHHRWLACELAWGKKASIPTNKIILPKVEALKLYEKISKKINK